MDILLAKPRNTRRHKIQRYAIAGTILVVIIFGVAALPVAFLYFAGLSKKDVENAGNEPSDATRPNHLQTIKTSPLKNSQPVAFVDVNVIPMDKEQVVPHQTVITRNGKISEIGPVDQIQIPAGTLRIDGRGKYLIPGFADMHVHFADDRNVNNALVQLFIANGVTTVLNMRGSEVHLDLRKGIANGSILGPTIYTCGPFINEPVVRTPAQVERAVIEQKKAGYDFIKIHGDLSKEAYHRLMLVAHRESIRVVGHAPRNLGINAVFEEHQDAVAHGEEYLYAYFYFNKDRSMETTDEETRKKYYASQEAKIPQVAEATAKAGTWVIPNLVAYQNIAEQVDDLDAVLKRPEMKYVIPFIATHWLPDRNTYKRRFTHGDAQYFLAQYVLLEKMTRGFRDAGVRMMAGTDAMNPSVVPGFSIHKELQDLVAAGLTPYQALLTATANPADFLGTLNTSGTIALGKTADMILLDKNPLDDIRNTSNQFGVMVHGQWLSKDDIKKILENLDESRIEN